MLEKLHTSNRYAVAAMLVAASSLVVMTGWSLWRAYEQQLAAAASQRQALALAADARLSASLRVVDRLLQDLGNERLRNSDPGSAQFNAFLAARLGFLPELNNLIVTDSDGIVRASSLPNIIGSNVASHPYFQLLHNSNSSFYLSEPFVGLTDSKIQMAAKPIHTPDGQFLGIAAVAIPSEYFTEILQHACPEQGGSILLFGSDLDIRMRLPELPLPPGQSMRGAPGVTEHLRGGNRSSDQRFIARLDGIERLATIRTLAFPDDLHLSITMNADSVLAPWRQQAIEQILLAAVVLTLLGVLLWINLKLRGDVLRTQHQQARAERQRLDSELLAVNEAKSLFLANMSHELRTPLNGVLGMLQLLDTTRLDPEQQEYLHTASASAWDLLTLLNELLDLSHLEAGRLQLANSNFALAPLLDSSLEPFRRSAGDKGLQLTVLLAPELPATVRGDAPRLRQILLNLIGNAVKFTPEGSVSLQVAAGRSPTADAPGTVIFRVQDSGIGIPAEQLDRIFEPFEQLDASFQKNYQGAGLGLTIVRKLTALMGGTIRIDSQLQDGTCVEVEIPLLAPTTVAT